MPDTPTGEQPPVHLEVRYEKTDTGLGPPAAMGTGIVVLVLLCAFIAEQTFAALKAAATREDPGLAALAAKERSMFPRDLDKIPPPRLEVDETLNAKETRLKGEQRLDSYGWIDSKKGIVHIPIAEAMRLLADPEMAKARGIRIEPAKGKGGGQ